MKTSSESEVTKQVALREKIKKNEALYRELIMGLPVAVYTCNAEGYVELYNQKAVELWGVEPKVGKSLWSDSWKAYKIDGSPLPFEDCPISITIREKRSVSFEFIVERPDGTRRSIIPNPQPIFDNEGNVTGAINTLIDITLLVENRKKIEASEEKLKIVIEATQLGTWELNLKTKEPIYSQRYLEIIGGYKENIELTHSQLLLHLHPDDHPIREKAYKDVFETGYLHYQARVIWNDKSIHWMEGRGKLFHDEENKPLKLIGTIRDITEEKNNEEELKKSEAKFTALANNIQNLAWMANADGWIYWYNDRWYEYTGKTPADMEGWGWQSVHDPEQLPSVLEKWNHSIKTGEPFEMVFPIKGADNIFRPFLTLIYPLRDPHGKIIQWVGTNTDISKQKEAEDQFRQMAERMPQKVWTADAEGNKNYFNQVMLDYSGLAYDELKNWGWEVIVHPDDKERNRRIWSESIRTGNDLEMETRFRRKDGEYLWHLTRAIAVKDERGKIKMWIGSKTEIQDQIKLSETLGENLKSSNERMQTILEHAPDAVISIDEEGIIRSWNHEAENIFGWKENEAIGNTLTETIIPQRYRKSHTSGITHFLKTGDGPVINKPIELSAIRKDGSEFPVELKISTSKINDRYIFIGFVRDISIRKMAEETIKNKTSQLMEAQHLAHIGSWEWDVLSNKIEWSDELYRIYGLVPQQFKADYENYIKYIHPDDRVYANEIVQQAIKDHQPFRFFHRTINEDGKERIISSTGKVLVDEVGNVIKMTGTAQDVTEQKKYEEELKISEERFYKIFDNNPVPMSLSEIKTNKIKYANTLFYNAFGYSNSEVIGNTSEDLKLIDPEEHKRVVSMIFGYLSEKRSLAELQALSKEETEELLVKLKESDDMKNFEILYTRKNGEKFPALVSFELIRIGKESYTVTSYQDITERKKAEALLKNQNEQLEKMNKELESFAYVSSHDLQEPLRKIQTFASQIIEKELKNLSDSGKDKFQRMQNAARRMQILIQDLLAYSRATTQERKFEFINLKKIVEGIKEDLKEELQQKNANIEMGNMEEIKIIPFQFRQLIFNLVTNSLKFSIEERAPHIKITSEIANGIKFDNKRLSNEISYCHINYTDNGIGFEEEYSEKIFEVFQRVHEIGKYQGTGIGLAIVKKIVENHNGVISAKGSLNKGATFDIYVPVN